MKKVLSIILLLNCFYVAFALDKIYISDIIGYDSKGNKTVLGQNTGNILKNSLNAKYYAGLFEFNIANSQKYGSVTSSSEAAKVCSQLNIQYLLYGYVRKDLNSWYTEIKLYNANSGAIEKIFFAADDINNYDRMIENIADKIYSYYKSVYEFDKQLEELAVQKEAEIKLPFALSYWTPIESRWNEVLFGCPGFNIGIEFYPSMEQKIVKTHLVDYSFRPEFAYKFGLGKQSRYKAHYHSFSFNLPIIYNKYYSTEHAMKIGMGVFYEFCLLSMVPKYDDSIIEYQNQLGLIMIGGYEYTFNEKWNFLAEANFKIPFLDRAVVSLDFKFGLSYKFENKGGN